jgi:hypothetical protein
MPYPSAVAQQPQSKRRYGRRSPRRERPWHSCTEIGDSLGVTKQTAWQRFSGEMRHPITGEEIQRKMDTPSN